MNRRLPTRRRRLAGLIATALVALSPALVQAAKPTETAETAAPDAAEAADAVVLREIEAYLNNIRTLTAKFIQVAPDGTISDGSFYLSRPGRVRFEYNPPSRLLIVSRDKWITLIDYDINQVSRWPIRDTPFGVLVGGKIQLGKTLGVAGIEQAPGLVSVTLYKRGDRKAGSVKLIFTTPPLQLRQWEITDGRGQVTRVGLSDVRINVEIADSRFDFKDPRRTRRQRRGR